MKTWSKSRLIPDAGNFGGSGEEPQIVRFFSVRNLSVSFFDESINGGALREFCDFRRGEGRKNLRETSEKKDR